LGDTLRRQRARARIWAVSERLRTSGLARLALGLVLLTRGALRLGRGRHLAALDDLCAVQRLVALEPLTAVAIRLERRALDRTCTDEGRPRPARRNELVEQFLAGPVAARIQRAAQDEPWDRVVRLGGDLILLKTHDPRTRELGVLLIKYNDAFLRFVALYDVAAVLRDFQIVLEPSWVGYALTEYLMFFDEARRVVVQAHHPSDYRHIERLGSNLVPIAIGAGYWVDDEVFRPLPGVEKKYAAIMVANWTPFKRHHVLLDALVRARDPALRVALVGYPWGGYERARIEELVGRRGLGPQVDLFERVPPETLNRLYNESRVNLLLSRREGAGKVVYEGLAAGTPCIVSADHESVRLEDVNERTGKLVRDGDLPAALVEMQSTYRRYASREWLLAHASHRTSTAKLEDVLKACAAQEGRPWIRPLAEKVNRPNARYRDDEVERRMLPAYGALLPYLRRLPSAPARAIREPAESGEA
jgi:glycosyltransferase involved in cell wall biosynthesis